MPVHEPELARPLRVVVADDDEQIRAAVGELLATDSRFDLVAAVADGDQAVEAVGESHVVV